MCIKGHYQENEKISHNGRNHLQTGSSIQNIINFQNPKTKKQQLKNWLEKTFLQKWYTVNNYMKKCSVSLVIREMQIKTCNRKWQPTPVFLAKFHGQRSPAGYSSWEHKESDNRACTQANAGEIPHYTQDDGYLQKSKYWGKIWRNWNSHILLQLL